jgi:hypothetical protein
VRPCRQEEMSPRVWGWTEFPGKKRSPQCNVPTRVGVDRAVAWDCSGHA